MICKRISFALALALIAAAPHAARAAPFCTQITGVPPECIYFDAGECRKRAAELKAICSANPNELRISTGTLRYCMVTGDRAALCQYADRQSCEIDAIRAGQAVCVDNFPVSKTQPDLFLTEPDRRY